MNILSLFDGHSTGYLALKQLGIKIDSYYSSEIDKYALQISENNFGNNIIRLGDITKINESTLKELPKIDIVLSGSPCQSFSRAGKGDGFNGESGLFMEFLRILDWIKKNNNKDVYFFQENVEMKKEYKDVISECLGVEPYLINSKLVSAQNRSRLYWTNIPFDNNINDRNIKLLDILEDIDTSNYYKYKNLLIDPNIKHKNIELIEVVDNEIRVKQATKLGYIAANNGDGINLQFPTSKTRRGRVINQKSSTLDCNCDICVYYNNIIRNLTITELERLQTLPDGYTKGIPESKRKHAIGNGWTLEVVKEFFKYFIDK